MTKVIIDKVYSSGGNSFYRLLWILPITFITVYSAILVVKMLPKKWMGILFTICLVAILIKIAPIEEYEVNGRLPENKYFISDEGIELNTLMGDQECEEEKYYIGDLNVYLNLETYSDHFVFPFWRGCFINFEEWISRVDEDNRPLFESVLQGIPADKNGRKQIANALEKNNISYIIISKAMFIENYYDKMGYHYIGETENYIVYEKDKLFTVNEKELVLPGAKKEYSIVVINDLHIIQMDDSIQQGQMETVRARYDGFCDYYGNHSADLWQQLINKVNEINPDCVILNGDMIDYFSFTNFNCLKEGITKIKAPVMYLRADHDLALWYTDSITAEKRGNTEIQIDSNDGILEMEFDDFIIMGFNNSTSCLKEDGLNKVREIWAKKKPVILATHVPLESQIDDSLSEKSKSVWGDRALLWGQNSYYKPDSITREFLDMVLAEDGPVIASIGGHLHFSFEDKLNSNIIQWVFDASHKRDIGCIKIKN